MAVLKDNSQCKQIMQQQQDKLVGQVDRLSILVTSDKDRVAGMAAANTLQGFLPPVSIAPDYVPGLESTTTHVSSTRSSLTTTVTSVGAPVPTTT